MRRVTLRSSVVALGCSGYSSPAFHYVTKASTQESSKKATASVFLKPVDRRVDTFEFDGKTVVDKRKVSAVPGNRRMSGSAPTNESQFYLRLQRIKQRHRGAHLYEEAQKDIRRLFGTIPRSMSDSNTHSTDDQEGSMGSLEEWLNEDNATAVINGMAFFEVYDPACRQGVITFLEDRISSFGLRNLLMAATSYLAVIKASGGNEKKNGVRSTSTDAIALLRQEVVPKLRAQLSKFRLSELAATIKLFQRCRIEEEELWNDVCSVVEHKGSSIWQDTTLYKSGKGAMAVRFFAAFVRFAPHHGVIRELLRGLTPLVSGMDRSDFAVFAVSLERVVNCASTTSEPERSIEFYQENYWALLAVLERLPQEEMSARDLGNVFSAIVKMLLNRESVSQASSTLEEQYRLTASLEDQLSRLTLRVVRHLTLGDPLYWPVAKDVLRICFAYETLSRTSHLSLMGKLKEYLVRRLSPAVGSSGINGMDIAMAIGILKRSGQWDSQIEGLLLKHLVQRLELAAHGEDDFEKSPSSLAYLALYFPAPPVAAPENSETHRQILNVCRLILTKLDQFSEADLSSMSSDNGTTTRVLKAVLTRQSEIPEGENGVAPVRLFSDLACTLPRSHPMYNAVFATIKRRKSELTEDDLTYLARREQKSDVLDLSQLVETEVRCRLLETKGGQWTPAVLKLLRIASQETRNCAVVDALDLAQRLQSNLKTWTHFFYLSRFLLEVYPTEPSLIEFVTNGAVAMLSASVGVVSTAKVSARASGRNVAALGGSMSAAKELVPLFDYLKLALEFPQVSPDADWLSQFLYSILLADVRACTEEQLEVVFRHLEAICRYHKQYYDGQINNNDSVIDAAEEQSSSLIWSETSSPTHDVRGYCPEVFYTAIGKMVERGVKLKILAEMSTNTNLAENPASDVRSGGEDSSSGDPLEEVERRLELKRQIISDEEDDPFLPDDPEDHDSSLQNGQPSTAAPSPIPALEWIERGLNLGCPAPCLKVAMKDITPAMIKTHIPTSSGSEVNAALFHRVTAKVKETVSIYDHSMTEWKEAEEASMKKVRDEAYGALERYREMQEAKKALFQRKSGAHPN